MGIKEIFTFFFLAIPAVVIGILSNAAWHFILLVIPRISESRFNEIDGFWLGRVLYTDTDDIHRYGYNLTRLKEIRSVRVLYYTEHADNLVPCIRVFRGLGVFRGDTFSSIFYHSEAKCHENGSATFRLISTRHGSQILSGRFLQGKDIGNFRRIQQQDYTLVRVNLPIRQQLRRIIGCCYFKDFDEMCSFVNSLPSELTQYLNKTDKKETEESFLEHPDALLETCPSTGCDNVFHGKPEQPIAS
jgi:hypothetical protein